MTDLRMDFDEASQNYIVTGTLSRAEVTSLGKEAARDLIDAVRGKIAELIITSYMKTHAVEIYAQLDSKTIANVAIARASIEILDRLVK